MANEAFGDSAMPVSIAKYTKSCPQDTPPDPHRTNEVVKLSPDQYRFSGTVPIRDLQGDNIISTVYTDSRTDKKTPTLLRSRNLCLR
jgi:hypothetical protein